MTKQSLHNVLAPEYDQKCLIRPLVLKTDVTPVQRLRLIILDIFFYPGITFPVIGACFFMHNQTIKCGVVNLTHTKQLLYLFCIV